MGLVSVGLLPGIRWARSQGWARRHWCSHPPSRSCRPEAPHPPTPVSARQPRRAAAPIGWFAFIDLFCAPFWLPARAPGANRFALSEIGEAGFSSSRDRCGSSQEVRAPSHGWVGPTVRFPPVRTRRPTVWCELGSGLGRRGQTPARSCPPTPLRRERRG